MSSSSGALFGKNERIRGSRVLFVEQNSDGTIGGSHKCLLTLVKNLDRDQFDCHVLFYQSNSMIGEFKRYSRVHLVSEPFRMKKGNCNSVLRRALNAVLVARDIIRFYFFLRKLKPDLIHMNNSLCVGYDTWAVSGKVLKIPVVTHERTYYSKEIMQRLAKYHVLFAKIFCVSEAIRNNCLDHGVSAEKMFTMYEGIDVDEFQSRIRRSRVEVRQEFDLGPEQPVLGIVGNIRHWKGQHVVLRALATIREKIPDVHCLIIGAAGDGDPSDRNYFREILDYVKQTGLESNVTITGFRDDIPDLLGALDLQIHASVKMEPFGIVLLEGMSLGVPIVASNAGGPAEILENGMTGLLFTPGSSEEMETCILRLLSNEHLRIQYGKAAIGSVARFDLKTYVNEISHHYNEIISRHKTAKDTPCRVSKSI